MLRLLIGLGLALLDALERRRDVGMRRRGITKTDFATATAGMEANIPTSEPVKPLIAPPIAEPAIKAMRVSAG